MLKKIKVSKVHQRSKQGLMQRINFLIVVKSALKNRKVVTYVSYSVMYLTLLNVSLWILMILLSSRVSCHFVSYMIIFTLDKLC